MSEVQLIVFRNANSSPLWRLGAEPIPEELELADDEQIVDWARRRWEGLAVLVLLTQEDGRTGALAFDVEGRVLNRADHERQAVRPPVEDEFETRIVTVGAEVVTYESEYPPLEELDALVESMRQQQNVGKTAAKRKRKNRKTD